LVVFLLLTPLFVEGKLMQRGINTSWELSWAEADAARPRLNAPVDEGPTDSSPG
jgi:hypothetical protein